MSRSRVRVLVLVVTLLFTVLAMRAVWLGVVRAGWLTSKADTQHYIPIDTPAQRGAIVSSDGQTLADDVPSMLITADPRHVDDPKMVADTIASATGGDEKRRDTMLGLLQSKSAYVVLAKQVSWEKGQYLQNLNMNGVHFESTLKRTYPMDVVAGQVLGLTQTDDGTGIDGLEKKLNGVLAGTAGHRVEVRDQLLGQTVRIDNIREPKAGKTVTITINADIQRKMEEVLVATRSEYKAKSASGIVMDPRSGAIYAIGSVPLVNPNNRAKLKADSLRLRPVTDAYEPGSVFKVVTVAGAMDEGLTTPTTLYHVPPFIKVKAGEGQEDYTVGDSHPRDAYEDMTTRQILQRSSNMGAITISTSLSKRNSLRKWMARFGFGTDTGVDTLGEEAGDLPKTPWNEGQRVNIPIGQGVTATLLQQARAYAAIANGGELVTPYLVKSVDGVATPAGPRKRILKASTAKQLTGILETVVEQDGTAVEASLKNYTVAGKTGTAQKVDPTTQKYSDVLFRSSFVGYVPASKPRLLIAVMVDQPDPAGPHTGGDVAAPAFRSIADFALAELSIPPG